LQVCARLGVSEALPLDSQDLDGDDDTTEIIPFDLDLNPRLAGSLVDMGVYAVANLGQPSELSIERAVLLRWPVTEQNFTVLRAPSVDGPWEPIAEPVFDIENFYQATIPTSKGSNFFQSIEAGASQP